MTQFEQENDLGRGGGEVDDDTLDAAWDQAEQRRGGGEVSDDPDLDEDE